MAAFDRKAELQEFELGAPKRPLVSAPRMDMDNAHIDAEQRCLL